MGKEEEFNALLSFCSFVTFELKIKGIFKLVIINKSELLLSIYKTVFFFIKESMNHHISE